MSDATISIQIIFASILERIFFHTKATASSVLGTLIIVAAAVWIAVSSSFLRSRFGGAALSLSILSQVTKVKEAQGTAPNAIAVALPELEEGLQLLERKSFSDSDGSVEDLRCVEVKAGLVSEGGPRGTEEKHVRFEDRAGRERGETSGSDSDVV